MEDQGVTDWNSLALALYKRYFPPQKTNALRNQITSFKQSPTEDLNEAWIRFKRLVRSVPYRGFQKWFLCNEFYNGLYNDHRALFDSSANGRFQDNTNDTNVWKLIDQIGTHTAKYGNPRGSTRGGGSSDGAVAAQLEALTTQIAELKTTQSLGNKQTIHVMTQQETPCEQCSAEHGAVECMSPLEQVDAFQSFKQGTPYSNFYNERTREHANFSYRCQNVLNPTTPPLQGLNPTYTIPQNRGNQPQGGYHRSNQGGQQYQNNDMSDKVMLQQQMVASEKQEALTTQLMAHNKMLDNQIAQLSTSSRQTGTLSSQLENPHDMANTIHIRSGLTYDGPVMPENVEEVIIEELDVDTKGKAFEEAVASISDKGKFKAADPPVVIKVLFPGRLKNTKVEQQFGKFLEVVKNIQVTVPFTKLITQVPSYAKFMKDILTRKRSFNEVETIAFTEECSALLQSKSPPKLKDPGSFSIPCTIDTHIIDKALCNLGARVSVMPNMVCTKLNMGHLKVTNVTL
ncbi:uncharacterized protein LOC141640996 [Silene latifolia]|uniref:uncharacterized protein LOC141640996 n=1 Tax=Silene latifolia TaxID=37657 RepID=UPI003D76ACD4